MRFLQALVCAGVVLAAGISQAATSFTDGFDSNNNPAPTLNDPLVIGNFDDGTTQGWAGVRMPAVEAVGGVLTNINTDGLGSDGNGDSWVWLNTGSNPLFTVGELPGQYDIVQFDIRIDTLPPQPADSRIRGRHFLQGGSVTNGVTYAASQSYPTDSNWRTYTVVRDFNDSAWNVAMNRVRIDIVDGVPNAEPAPVLGTKFSVDNVILGRTTATEAFPAIEPVQTNIVRNGDLSQVSNLVLGSNPAAADINGGNGNFGPFRGSSVDVDEWTPYNNNPNMIVEAVNGPDGTGLNLLNLAGDTQGSFYLDTHYSVTGEQFSLNSAGGYKNGLIQTDVLNGVAIDAGATYELGFDLAFNDRPANSSSDFTVALTVGANSTDTNTAVAGSLFADNLGNITAGERQTVSISGAALLAAQSSGEVNLIVESQANTSIVNFPGTPVADNHRDTAVFTQVQVDNFSLVKEFVQITGDVNKDGLVTQADVTLAQLYHDGNGGETAEKRQNDLFNAPSAPFEAEILASLNLTDFDLVAPFDFFDQADVDAIAALVTSVPGDFDDDGDVDGADFLGWQRTDPSQIPTWQGNYGVGALSSVAAVPEPASLVMVGVALVAVAAGRCRLS